MLIHRFCLLGALLAAPNLLAAEVAQVSGGEHADFTRLVVEAKAAGDWRLGHVEDGYELQLGSEVTSFDVRRAFEKIPRDRISALWRDPETGRLRFSLACACHAVAFEFRPGIVVVDIRTGPPPEGSSFEVALDQPAEANSEPEKIFQPSSTAAEPVPAGGYDWVALERDRVAEDIVDALPLPLPTGETSLDPLRDALLSQISKGVAEGVVEVVDGPPPKVEKGAEADEGPWARISVGELPGLKAGDERDKRGSMTAAGEACLPEQQFDVASWGQAGAVAGQLGLARSGMLTEFDAPVPAAILRAARFHVFLGFGAEARQYLQFLDGADPEAANVLQAMAYIVDGEPVEKDAFPGMESCDGAAALWATLARSADGVPPPSTNTEAVARSFSALPPHLRRHLGSTLVEMFLAVGDEETAHRLREAILRLPTTGDPQVELMDARYQLAKGDVEAATKVAEGLLSESGPADEAAAIMLVEAAFRGERRVDSGLPSAIDSFLLGAQGTGTEADLIRAKVLANAMIGNYFAAFSEDEISAETFGDLWALAATNAPDDVFLSQAAGHADLHPKVTSDTGSAIAKRLSALGFPDLALSWLGSVDAQSPAEVRLLAASAHLALRDAPSAFELLIGLDGEDAETLRAAATLQLGDAKAASEALLLAGDPVGSARAVVWTQDWSLIEENGPDPWQAAVDLLVEPSGDTAPGPIARGEALVEESAAARATLEALLGAVTEPPVTQ